MTIILPLTNINAVAFLFGYVYFAPGNNSLSYCIRCWCVLAKRLILYPTQPDPTMLCTLYSEKYVVSNKWQIFSIAAMLSAMYFVPTHTKRPELNNSIVAFGSLTFTIAALNLVGLY